MPQWKSSAGLSAIKARARLNADIRQFFAKRKVLEVDVPIIAAATITDPFIESLSTYCNGKIRFLQTSPEFFMKRLLASFNTANANANIDDCNIDSLNADGDAVTSPEHYTYPKEQDENHSIGAIYSLGKAFRNGESGRRHNPEFTLLEWYQPGFDDHQLMAEVVDLLRNVLPFKAVQSFSYRAVFQRYIELDPHTASLEQLQIVTQKNMHIEMNDDASYSHRDTWLDLLISHVIEVKLAQDFPEDFIFIYDYPATQAALAKITFDSSGEMIARRFEGFYRGIELCNGYWELTDAQEQRQRFLSDQNKRQSLSLPQHPSDSLLLDALEQGLPSCAGVALGIDRLLMLQLEKNSLDEVISFPIKRA